MGWVGAPRRRSGHQLVQQLDVLGAKLAAREQTDSGDVAAGAVERVDQAGLDRIVAADEDDRDRAVAAFIASAAGGAPPKTTAAGRRTSSAVGPANRS